MNKILTMIIASVIIIAGIGVAYAGETNEIPEWVKGVFAYYVNDKITDAELLDALQFLIDDGILDISEKTYEPFSKEKFPSTGGFNPAWLEGEKSLILESCKEASSMGYENPYCKYVQ